MADMKNVGHKCLTYKNNAETPTAAQNSAESPPSLARCASTRSGGGTGWG